MFDRRFTLVLAAGVYLAALAGFAGAAIAQGWQSYHNPRFGYTVDYPAGLFGPPTQSENGDGLTLVSRDGDARLLLFGGHNTAGHSPGGLADSLASIEGIREVTYRRVADDWIVLSGYLSEPENGETMIFYWRVEFNDDHSAISGFRIEYPVSQRDPFDGLVGAMGRSLTPPAVG